MQTMLLIDRSLRKNDLIIRNSENNDDDSINFIKLRSCHSGNIEIEFDNNTDFYMYIYKFTNKIYKNIGLCLSTGCNLYNDNKETIIYDFEKGRLEIKQNIPNKDYFFQIYLSSPLNINYTTLDGVHFFEIINIDVKADDCANTPLLIKETATHIYAFVWRIYFLLPKIYPYLKNDHNYKHEDNFNFIKDMLLHILIRIEKADYI
ncbi:LOW QUALITY PROTEIN: hypothetical protein HZS_4311 [Henneguya salminicola]|nr:LOW QUALITY PROTEIN: hypothetical protein HZS_4311 [Henneguya salminicola]